MKNQTLYCVKKKTCYLKLTGSITYTESPVLGGLIRSQLKDENVINFVIDLCDTEYLDSTILGLLGMIAVDIESKSSEKAVIYSPQKDINTILKAVAFNTLFTIKKEKLKGAKPKYKDIGGYDSDKSGTREIILESHETLSKVNNLNKKKFAQVVESIKNKD